MCARDFERNLKNLQFEERVESDEKAGKMVGKKPREKVGRVERKIEEKAEVCKRE